MEVRKGFKHTDVGTIPEDWKLRKLGDEIERLDAGVSVNSVNDEVQIYAHDLYILKTSAVSNGKFNFLERKKIAPKDISRAKLTPRANTIIISRMNTPELVGECGFVEHDYQNVFCLIDFG
jgi:type I restriction enzyme, S subunit